MIRFCIKVFDLFDFKLFYELFVFLDCNNDLLLNITYCQHNHKHSEILKKNSDLLIDFDESLTRPEESWSNKKEECSVVEWSNQFTLNYNEITERFISLLYDLVSSK